MSSQRGTPFRSTTPYRQNCQSTSRQNYHRLLATLPRQNYHRRSATPPRQNYHRRSITLPRHSCQINRNYRDIESRSRRSISPNERYRSRRRSRSPDEKDKEISFLKSTVESLINEVNKLKSDKATTSNNPSECVDVDDTETTGVMRTTGLSCPMDNIGFCDLDADETTITPCDTNETTVAPCDNTNSAIATSLVNPSNKKGKQSKDHNVPANNLRKSWVTPEPPSGYMKKFREYLEEMIADQALEVILKITEKSRDLSGTRLLPDVVSFDLC
ncbi:9557_t:CDS:2 [Gigaspora rosea]|nr:9557_t:CDS:2 [Gigaspora rosea]